MKIIAKIVLTLTVSILVFNNKLKAQCSVPIINFTATPSCPCNVVNFNTTTIGTSYTWTFGDGATNNMQNPSHTFIEPGNNYITKVSHV